MNVLNPRNWSLLDWISVLCFVGAAVVQALNAALQDAPRLAAVVPTFLSWAYLPLGLICLAFSIVVYRLLTEKASGHARDAVVPTRREAGRERLVHASAGPFQIVYDPPLDFVLLPINYFVDLRAPLPYVQASFHAVSLSPD